MNKRIINSINSVLIIILIIISVFVVINFTRLSKEFNIGTKFDHNNRPRSHYMVIVDGSDLSYVEELQYGMDQAAEENSVVYEMWAFDGENKEESIIKQFDMGIESRVDGIIIQAFDDKRFERLLAKANTNNIPVITLIGDIVKQEKVTHISYNRYQIGTNIGNMLNQYLEDMMIRRGTIILLENGTKSDRDQSLAIKETMNKGFEIRPETVNYQGENMLNAEGLTRSIINQYGDIRAIVCQSGEETLGVIVALKDLNKINDIIVIGSDDYEEILEYISRGVIYATIISDNEKMGYEAISSIVHHDDKEFVSQYMNIDVRIIDQSNVDAYMREIGEHNEQ